MIDDVLVGAGYFRGLVYLVGGDATKNFVGTSTFRACGAIFCCVGGSSAIYTTGFIRFYGGFCYVRYFAIGDNKGALLGVGNGVNQLVKYRFKEGSRFRRTLFVVGQLINKILGIGAFITWVPGIFVL